MVPKCSGLVAHRRRTTDRRRVHLAPAYRRAGADGDEALAPVPVPTAAAPEQTWTMSDLRGRNLQDAQDAIQALTNNEVFYTGSTDLTGADEKSSDGPQLAGLHINATRGAHGCSSWWNHRAACLHRASPKVALLHLVSDRALRSGHRRRRRTGRSRVLRRQLSRSARPDDIV
jgi:hypothetical protein